MTTGAFKRFARYLNRRITIGFTAIAPKCMLVVGRKRFGVGFIATGGRSLVAFLNTLLARKPVSIPANLVLIVGRNKLDGRLMTVGGDSLDVYFGRRAADIACNLVVTVGRNKFGTGLMAVGGDSFVEFLNTRRERKPSSTSASRTCTVGRNGGAETVTGGTSNFDALRNDRLTICERLTASSRLIPVGRNRFGGVRTGCSGFVRRVLK